MAEGCMGSRSFDHKSFEQFFQSKMPHEERIGIFPGLLECVKRNETLPSRI